MSHYWLNLDQMSFVVCEGVPEDTALMLTLDLLADWNPDRQTIQEYLTEKAQQKKFAVIRNLKP